MSSTIFEILGSAGGWGAAEVDPSAAVARHRILEGVALEERKTVREERETRRAEYKEKDMARATTGGSYWTRTKCGVR